MPLPQGPQQGGKLLKHHVEKDAAEDDVPALSGRQGAHCDVKETQPLGLKGAPRRQLIPLPLHGNEAPAGPAPHTPTKSALKGPSPSGRPLVHVVPGAGFPASHDFQHS